MQKENFTKKLKEILEQGRISIENSLKKFATKNKKTKGNWDVKFPEFNSNDLDESADEVEEYQNLLSVESSLEKKLKDITIALEKIKKGKYGICENCKKEISKERLEILPEARKCIKCN